MRLLFPPEGVERPCSPVTGEDGRPRWPEGSARPQARIYTIRRIDATAGRVDIDMVLHGARHGPLAPGARFAARAVIGDVVGMTGPGGGTVPEAEHLLLAGDETALPAIGRILETLGAQTAVTVLVEVGGPSDEQALSTRAKLDLRWLCRGSAPPGTTTLLEDAVQACRFPERSRIFAWIGCEAQGARAIRRHLRIDCGLAREEHLAVAYWRRGFAGDEARGTD